MIHLISFFQTDSPFVELYQSQVDICHLFKTDELLEKYPEFKNYISPMPEYIPIKGWETHFGKWKPFLIFKYLTEMKENDILVYYDDDVISNVRNDISMINRTDLMAIIDPNLLNKDCIKPDVFTKVGDYRNTKTLHTHRILLRKTKRTESFVRDWLNLCETPMLLPSIGVHTYEQALFNVLYYKYVEQKIFPALKYKEPLEKTFPDIPVNHVKPPARKMLGFHISKRPQMLTLKPLGL